jgi:hypothetical protein
VSRAGDLTTAPGIQDDNAGSTTKIRVRQRRDGFNNGEVDRGWVQLRYRFHDSNMGFTIRIRAQKRRGGFDDQDTCSTTAIWVLRQWYVFDDHDTGSTIAIWVQQPRYGLDDHAMAAR